MEGIQKSFTYSFNQQKHTLVVTLDGDLHSDVMPALEALKVEILGKKEIRQVVLYFKEVTIISTDAISILALMQREIRAMPAELRLCSLEDKIKERLVRMGVVRGLELTDDLRSALLSLN